MKYFIAPCEILRLPEPRVNQVKVHEYSLSSKIKNTLSLGLRNTKPEDIVSTQTFPGRLQFFPAVVKVYLDDFEEMQNQARNLEGKTYLVDYKKKLVLVGCFLTDSDVSGIWVRGGCRYDNLISTDNEDFVLLSSGFGKISKNMWSGL